MNTPAQGNNLKDFRSADDVDSRRIAHRQFLWPYLLLMASQLPLSAVYLTRLWWERPHYRMLPVAIAGCAFFLFQRWPRANEPSFFPSLKSTIFLTLGLILAALATLWLSPWCSFAAFLCFSASLLARTNDRQVFGTLLSTMAPLALILQPPVAMDFDTVQGDIQLMSALNNGATKIASDSLDLMQYPHNVADHRMEFPRGEFSSEALGNNLLSVFTLLILTGLCIAWQRMTMFRAVMLLLAALFWYMTFEALEMIICVVMDSTFEQNLYAPGLGNRILQSAGLVAAGIMTLLSERLIAFLFGPVDLQSVDENISYQQKLCRLWNHAIAGTISPTIDVNVKKEVAWAKRRNSMPGQGFSRALWATAIALLILAGIQVLGIGSAWSQSGGSIFSSARTPLLTEDFLESEATQLSQTDYQEQTPLQNSVFQSHQHQWTFQDAAGRATYRVTIRGPNSGWQDSDRQIRSFDWKRQANPEPTILAAGDRNVAVYRTGYRNNMVEYRTAFDAQIDGYGMSFQVPWTWRNPADFLGRAAARLEDRTRPRLLSGLSLQITVTVDTIGPNPEPSQQQAADLFQDVVQKILIELTPANGPPVDQQDAVVQE